MSEHKYPRIEAATANEDLKKKDDKKTSIIFLSIALALFLACVGFLVWNIVRMRKVDTDYVKVLGKVVDVETMGTSSSASSGRSYFLVISYTFDGQEYKFIDREGYKWHDEAYDCVGKYADILVDPQNPAHAERPTSSGFISTFCACCFAFFCIIYAAGMNIFLAQGKFFYKEISFYMGSGNFARRNDCAIVLDGNAPCQIRRSFCSQQRGDRRNGRMRIASFGDFGRRHHHA